MLSLRNLMFAFLCSLCYHCDSIRADFGEITQQPPVISTSGQISDPQHTNRSIHSETVINNLNATASESNLDLLDLLTPPSITSNVDSIENEKVFNEPDVQVIAVPTQEIQINILVDESQNIKEKAIGNLMKIFGLPDSSLRENPPGPAPEFMIDLYNTITDSYGVTRAKNPYDAHVVRSFIERDNSLYDYFSFNISGLEDTESVLEAELHIHRLQTAHEKLHPSLYLTPFYILSLYQVLDPKNLAIPDLHKLLGVHYVPALGSGWEIFNVKQAVVEWVRGDRENYGFLVAATSLGGDRVPVRFSRRGETQHSKQPILVLFDEDTSMRIFKHQATVNNRKHIKARVNDNFTSSNETEEITSPASSLENPRFHHALLYKDSIRHPNSVSRFRSRRSKNQTETFIPANRTLTECGRHDLFVSFEAIGWSSWIISPKGYNAFYCDGPCAFPLGQQVRPTNHATVQSIVHELNLSPGINRPCCVPTTLLPISLLYYDDHDNVVLKQYVDMVADSCGCH